MISKYTSSVLVPSERFVGLLGNIRTTGEFSRGPCGHVGDRHLTVCFERIERGLERLRLMHERFRREEILTLRTAVLAMAFFHELSRNRTSNGRVQLWILWEWMRYGALPFRERHLVWGLLLARLHGSLPRPGDGSRWGSRLAAFLPPRLLQAFRALETAINSTDTDMIIAEPWAARSVECTRDRYARWCQVEGICDDVPSHITEEGYSGHLRLLVGIPGSGKTRWAKIQRVDHIVSMDWLRRRIVGREEDQTKNSFVFGVAMRHLKARLGRGEDVVYDATNVTCRARRTALRIAGQMNARVTAVFFDTSFRVCIDRNARRPRRVPIPAMIRFAIDLVPPLPHEYDMCVVVS